MSKNNDPALSTHAAQEAAQRAQEAQKAAEQKENDKPSK